MAPPTKPAADSGKPIGRQLYEATRDGNEEEVDALLRKGAPVSFMSVQFHPQTVLSNVFLGQLAAVLRR